MEYTIIHVEGGPAWVFVKPAGFGLNYATAYRCANMFQAIAKAEGARIATAPVAPPEEVSAEWNTYCEHHKWNQDPTRSETWGWKDLPHE